MVNVVGIRFKDVGKIYYFDPDGMEIKEGMNVIVETVRGVEFGEVVIANRMIHEEEIVSPLKKVMRIATQKDIIQYEENIKKEKEAFKICLEKIEKHDLIMKLIDVEYTFDRNKVLFYFTADGRVDFRELVKDLASVFKTRIELRQIGVRDEAKMVGGLGVCGRGLCCKTFLCEFEPVSIKMAKEQCLSLNPTKISGVCGRLMCCLRYEHEVYEELIHKTPKVGAIVKTKSGEGVVESVNLIKGDLKVKLDADGESIYENFKANEIEVIKDVENVDDSQLQEEELKELEKLEDKLEDN
jgi:cell fate regulator YaaT (PSP1 superfamily)